MENFFDDAARASQTAIDLSIAPQLAKDKLASNALNLEQKRVELDKSKREEKDITDFATESTKILGRVSTPPDVSKKDTSGGYEDPTTTKMNDLIQAKQAEVKQHQEQKQKLNDLAMAAERAHNPTVAEKYRAQAEDFDDKARDSAEATMRAQATKDEAIGRYGAAYLAGPKDDQSWNSMLLDGLQTGVISPDEAGNLIKTPPEKREQVAKAAMAHAESAKIRSTTTIASAKLAQAQDRMDAQDARFKERMAFKDKEFQAHREDARWNKEEKIAKTDQAAAKEHHAELKDVANTSIKNYEAASKNYNGLLSARQKLQTQLAMNVEDDVVKGQLKDIENAIDKAEVDVQDSQAAMKEDTQAEKVFAKKLGVPASTAKSSDGIHDKAEFDKAVKALQHPPAGKPAPTASDIAYVKAHPEMAKQFEAHFGVEP